MLAPAGHRAIGSGDLHLHFHGLAADQEATILRQAMPGQPGGGDLPPVSPASLQAKTMPRRSRTGGASNPGRRTAIGLVRPRPPDPRHSRSPLTPLRDRETSLKHAISRPL